MEPVAMHWWLNLASAAGIAVLAVPAWSLNVRKKRLQEIREALPEAPARFRDRVRAILRDKRGREVADWRPIDERCLALGYLLLLGSAVLRLLLPAA
jgi:hypothetical protein